MDWKKLASLYKDFLAAVYSAAFHFFSLAV
ncbi:MAG: hypothetical protein UW92_C0007G0017 [Candidatus Jorgensenbacteria bacterium GW2011_GWA2_45_13]|uniref:Uncharacterized protein n=1 Tax=Candidatus Jorgensenbacteria bacterium GW2011_GWA2_45_13 TaxID=1618662 RepID=A0A0G1L7J9_9BACT|nr:MAG: hypothetical protein UW92_C0007G0017 [Candidatus Jorgensenbacteria bacterium GW2011_GWA2_45_13]